MGIEAKSHSSSIDAADAKALVDGLGKERAKRQAKPEVDTKAEAEQYNLEDLSRSKEAKANRIVPPHLRGGGAPAQEPTPAAQRPAEAPVQPSPSAPESAARPASAPVQAFRPAPAQAASSDALDEAPSAPAQRPAGAPAPRPGAAPDPAAQRPAPAPAAPSQAAPAGGAPSASSAQPGKPSPISRPLDPRQAAKIAAAGVVRRADEVVVH